MRPYLLSLPIIASVMLAAAQRPAAAEDVSALVKKIKPAVVTILAYQTEDASAPSKVGTGFFLTEDRLVTNWHVIRGAKKLEFRDSQKKSYAITGVAGTSPKHDIAVLVPENGYRSSTTLTAADFVPDAGAKAYVLGSPLGLDHSVSGGLVSAKRELDGHQVIQITAAISPGSSGSPVFDSKGRVFGVATFRLKGGQSLNFAIPITHAVKLLKGKPEPVGKATAASDDDAHGSQAGGVRNDRFYALCAEVYCAQPSRRPGLKLGLKGGSVGHLERNVRVFQVLSSSSALMGTGNSGDPLFRIDGLDFRNISDGELLRFSKKFVLAQFNTYQYESVGRSNTVYAVKVLDRAAFIKALKIRLKGPSDARDKAVSARNEAAVAAPKLQRELRSLKDGGRRIERAIELKRRIAMYSQSMKSNPRIQKKVDQMQAELEGLSLDQEAIQEHKKALEAVTNRIRQNESTLQAAKIKVGQAEGAMPHILSE